MREITKDATSQSIDVFITDSSTSTGVGLAGLTYTSAGLTAYYRRGGTGTLTSITLASLASSTASYSAGGFVEISAANAKGAYRLDLPNAVVATGVDYVTIYMQGATNMAPVATMIQLKALDQQTATVPANVTQINSSATTMSRFDRGVKGVVLFTVGNASTASSIVFSSLDPASQIDDQYNGKVVTFSADTTTLALRGQSTTITNYTHSSLTAAVDTLTTAPSSGDTGTIS
jgi:hypothetical protein